jgi:hypothetical protein
MNVEQKVVWGYAGQDFRHPEHGFNRCPAESDWDAVTWLGVGTKPTLAELTAVPTPSAVLQEEALASIYEPVEFNGVMYPADADSMAKYEMAKQSRSRGKATKGIVIAVDGSVLKLSTPAEIDAFHGTIEDVVVARLAAVHDAL